MENKYFYIRPNNIADEIYQVEINVYNKLSIFALNLEPLPAINSADGYILALNHFFAENPEDELAENYQKATSNAEGKQFFNTIMSLTLLEKRFRENGIKELADITVYNSYTYEYQKQIALNNEVYGVINTLRKK